MKLTVSPPTAGSFGQIMASALGMPLQLFEVVKPLQFSASVTGKLVGLQAHKDRRLIQVTNI